MTSYQNVSFYRNRTQRSQISLKCWNNDQPVIKKGLTGLFKVTFGYGSRLVF